MEKNQNLKSLRSELNNIGTVHLPETTNLEYVSMLGDVKIETTSGMLYAPKLIDLKIHGEQKTIIKAPILLKLEVNNLSFIECDKLKKLNIDFYSKETEVPGSLEKIKSLKLEHLDIAISGKYKDDVKKAGNFLPETLKSLSYEGPFIDYFNLPNLVSLELEFSQNLNICIELPNQLKKLRLLSVGGTIDLKFPGSLLSLHTNCAFSKEMKLPFHLDNFQVEFNSFKLNPDLMKNMEVKELTLECNETDEDICVKLPRWIGKLTVEEYYSNWLDFSGSEIDEMIVEGNDFVYGLPGLFPAPGLANTKLKRIEMTKPHSEVLINLRYPGYLPKTLTELKIDTSGGICGFYSGIFPESLETLILVENNLKLEDNAKYLTKSLKKLILINPTKTPEVGSGIVYQVEEYEL